MNKRWPILLLIVLVMMFGGSAFAFAFTDIQGDQGEADIIALKEAGVISGITAELFAPRGKLTYAESVHMLVKGLDMKIDQQKTSNYFTKVPDDAWYAKSFIIAQLNGLPIPKDVDPTQNITKEQFAHLLLKAILTKGDYAFPEIYIMLEDEKDVSADMKGSIQALLVSKIADLDNGYFYPKKEITRSEAAQMLNKAIRFVKTTEPLPPIEEPVDSDVKMTVSKVDDEVNKVTVTWGEKPNPGYGISVSKIEFSANGEAYIYYKLHYPEKNKVYPQVITEAKTDTFLSSKFKPVLKKGSNAKSDSGGSAGAGVHDTPASSGNLAE